MSWRLCFKKHQNETWLLNILNPEMLHSICYAPYAAVKMLSLILALAAMNQLEPQPRSAVTYVSLHA